MVQESIFNKRIAIIGAGPAGCICAKFLQDENLDVSLFEARKPLQTILATGGGRCNLAHSQFDVKSLAKNYPRGEKFLYSIFTKFGTQNTLDFFKNIGIKTYTQEDSRIFPISNSAKEVQTKFTKAINKCNFIYEKVVDIEYINDCYKITTNKCSYGFDIVVIAIGGHSNLNILDKLDIKIIPQTQSLVGLVTKEDFKDLSGISLKNIKINNKSFKHLEDDILFTHKGISGPLTYKISSLKAKDTIPYTLSLRLIEDINLQMLLDKNSHKEIKNLLGQLIPKAFALWVLNNLNIQPETPCHKINGQMRNKILNKLTNFEINIIGKVSDGEVVTCGGVDLKSINSKTLEYKDCKNLYFCGEILDIDGFCGGFNLQNCWSTGFVVAQSIINS